MSRPLALTGWLPVWDVERRRADPAAVVAWCVHTLRRLGHRVDDLETLHLHLDARAAREAARDLTSASVDPAARAALHHAIRSALPELPYERLWVQTRAHFRILVSGDDLAAVPTHTDHGIGHALAERNLWLALTDAPGTAALHLCSLRESLGWLVATGRLHGLLDDAPEPQPVPTRAGDLLLFTPLHLHRARPPGERTRVSVDLRLCPRAGPPNVTFSPLQGDP